MTFLLINIIIALLIRKPLLASLVFASLFGTTYQIGQFDWSNYETLYQIIANRTFTEALTNNTIGHYEPIYSISLTILSRITGEYWVAKTLLYFVGFLYFSLSLSKSTIHNLNMFAFSFLSLTSYPLLYTADRQALALLFVTGALLNGQKGLIALGFHYSSLIIYLIKIKPIKLIATLPILFIPVYLIIYKYLYIFNPGVPSISSILMACLTILLLMTSKRKTNIALLGSILVLTCVLMFFPPLFYRLKFYFIVVILIYIFQNWRRNFDNPVISAMTLALFAAINILYVQSDPLAFGNYQTYLLKNYIDYPDKTNLWYNRFRMGNE